MFLLNIYLFRHALGNAPVSGYPYSPTLALLGVGRG